jgi:hypothetical protein
MSRFYSYIIILKISLLLSEADPDISIRGDPFFFGEKYQIAKQFVLRKIKRY